MTRRTGIPCPHIIFLLRMNNQSYSYAFNPRWLIEEEDLPEENKNLIDDFYKEKVAAEEEGEWDSYLDSKNNEDENNERIEEEQKHKRIMKRKPGGVRITRKKRH